MSKRARDLADTVLRAAAAAASKAPAVAKRVAERAPVVAKKVADRAPAVAKRVGDRAPKAVKKVADAVAARAPGVAKRVAERAPAVAKRAGETVAAAGEREPDDVLFADDDPVDVAFDAIEQLCGAPGLEGGFLGRGRHAAVQSRAGIRRRFRHSEARPIAKTPPHSWGGGPKGRRG